MFQPGQSVTDCDCVALSSALVELRHFTFFCKFLDRAKTCAHPPWKAPRHDVFASKCDPNRKSGTRKWGRPPGVVIWFRTGQHFQDFAVNPKHTLRKLRGSRRRLPPARISWLRMLRPDCVLIKQIKVSAQPVGRLLATLNLFLFFFPGSSSSFLAR